MYLARVTNHQTVFVSTAMAKRLVRGKGGLRMISVDGHGSIFDLAEPSWDEDSKVTRYLVITRLQNIVTDVSYCSIHHAVTPIVQLSSTFCIGGYSNFIVRL